MLTKEHIKIARRNGLKEETVKKRVYSYKWDVERAVTEPVRGSEKLYCGMTFRELSKLAERHGMNPLKLRSRLRLGWDLEKALYDKRRESPLTPEHIKEAERNGLKLTTVRNRIYNLGWSIEEAISTPVKDLTKGNWDAYKPKKRKGRVKI